MIEGRRKREETQGSPRSGLDFGNELWVVNARGPFGGQIVSLATGSLDRHDAIRQAMAISCEEWCPTDNVEERRRCCAKSIMRDGM